MFNTIFPKIHKVRMRLDFCNRRFQSAKNVRDVQSDPKNTKITLPNFSYTIFINLGITTSAINIPIAKGNKILRLKFAMLPIIKDLWEIDLSPGTFIIPCKLLPPRTVRI